MQQNASIAAADLLPVAARLKAQKIASIEGSPVFAIPGGWVADILRADPAIVTADTPSAFETAVQDPEVATIFVSRDTFGWRLMERILTRNSLVKTIFWEE